jgi:tripartite-type tricarboxylate transporter receptor subunit TctC
MQQFTMPRRALIGAAGLAALAGPAGAQAWPNQPVRVLVPFPPAGLADLLARIVAPRLAQDFGQPFVVENRPGSGGTIGADAAARSAPDGHTLLVSSAGPLSINQYLYATMPYDTARAFAPICLLASTPKVMVVNRSRPWRGVADVVAAAKAAPGRLTAGSAGSGTSLHLALELFKRVTGTDITHVPYRGAAPAVNDLVAGQIDLLIDNVPNILPQIRGDGVRALAAATADRLPQLPALPTMREQGVDFIFGTWFGLAAPAGTPAAILNRVAQAVTAAMADPAVGGRLRELGAEPGGGTPEGFAAFIEADRARLEPVIRAAGIRAE